MFLSFPDSQPHTQISHHTEVPVHQLTLLSHNILHIDYLININQFVYSPEIKLLVSPVYRSCLSSLSTIYLPKKDNPFLSK